MTPEIKKALIEQLTKRLKSFLWRAGAMFCALLVDFALQNLGLFHLSPALVTVLGLALGEASKFLNTSPQ